MRTWDDYKQTMPVESTLFEHARNGDLGFFETASLSKEELNQQNHKGYSPLMLAAYNGHTDLVKYLLSAGADPNSSDLTGNTVLMGASFKGELEIVRLLVTHGADIHALNPNAQSALHFAQMFGRTDVVKFLKSSHHQPETFGLTDVLSGWGFFFLNKHINRKNK